MSSLFTFSMFFLSFVPLWLVVIFIDCKSIFIDENDHIITEILFGLIVIFIGIISFIVVYSYLHSKRMDNINRYIVENAEECKTITSDFFISYVLPLFAFDFTQWAGVFEFLVFFAALAFLCIKHNHLSVNIVLELMGFRMYKCLLLNSDNKKIERIVITKEILTIKIADEIDTRAVNNEFLRTI